MRLVDSRNYQRGVFVKKLIACLLFGLGIVGCDSVSPAGTGSLPLIDGGAAGGGGDEPVADPGSKSSIATSRKAYGRLCEMSKFMISQRDQNRKDRKQDLRGWLGYVFHGAGDRDLDSRMDWAGYHARGDEMSQADLAAYFKGGYIWSIFRGHLKFPPVLFDGKGYEQANGEIDPIKFDGFVTAEFKPWIIELGIIYQQIKILLEKLGNQLADGKYRPYEEYSYVTEYENCLDNLLVFHVNRVIVEASKDERTDSWIYWISGERSAEKQKGSTAWKEVISLIEDGKNILKHWGRPVPDVDGKSINELADPAGGAAGGLVNTPLNNWFGKVGLLAGNKGLH